MNKLAEAFTGRSMNRALPQRLGPKRLGLKRKRATAHLNWMVNRLKSNGVDVTSKAAHKRNSSPEDRSVR